MRGSLTFLQSLSTLPSYISGSPDLDTLAYWTGYFLVAEACPMHFGMV